MILEMKWVGFIELPIEDDLEKANDLVRAALDKAFPQREGTLTLTTVEQTATGEFRRKAKAKKGKR